MCTYRNKNLNLHPNIKIIYLSGHNALNLYGKWSSSSFMPMMWLIEMTDHYTNFDSFPLEGSNYNCKQFHQA